MTNPFNLPDDLTRPEDDLIAKANAGQLLSLGNKRRGEPISGSTSLRDG